MRVTSEVSEGSESSAAAEGRGGAGSLRSVFRLRSLFRRRRRPAPRSASATSAAMGSPYQVNGMQQYHQRDLHGAALRRSHGILSRGRHVIRGMEPIRAPLPRVARAGVEAVSVRGKRVDRPRRGEAVVSRIDAGELVEERCSCVPRPCRTRGSGESSARYGRLARSDGVNFRVSLHTFEGTPILPFREWKQRSSTGS